MLLLKYSVSQFHYCYKNGIVLNKSILPSLNATNFSICDMVEFQTNEIIINRMV